MMIYRLLSASGCGRFDQSQEKYNILIYVHISDHLEEHFPYNCDTIEELECLFY